MDMGLFYGSSLTAGSILIGFCGVFLAFRIQRESSYYRQPAVDFTSGRGKDIYLGLTHFTSSLLLILLATLSSFIFGLVFPLLGLLGIMVTPIIIFDGIISSVVFSISYFVAELVHYGLFRGILVGDRLEWKSTKYIWLICLFIICFVSVTSIILIKV